MCLFSYDKLLRINCSRTTVIFDELHDIRDNTWSIPPRIQNTNVKEGMPSVGRGCTVHTN